MISQIDNELKPMLEKTYEELNKLYIKETHLLYKQSLENRKIMKTIDKEARNLVSEIRIITTQLESTNSGLQKVSIYIQRLETERSKRPPEKKEKFGFAH